MEILDAQAHMWLSDRPTRPWVSGYREAYRDRLSLLINAGQSMGPEALLLEMAEAGVDGAVLSPVGVYGMNNSFELASARRYPRKFCVVGWIDHEADDVEERLEADVAQGMVGIRLIALRDQARHDRREFDRLLSACERIGCGVAFSLAHPISSGVRDVIRTYQGINFQIDHLGVGFSPPVLGPVPENPFVNLPSVLELAKFPNTSMKLTGAPSLSRETYPFKDIWDAVYRIVDAFGPERVMWGSDFTRTSGLVSYWDGTHYLSELTGLGTEELRRIYGGTLRAILGWDPPSNIRPSC
jgi:L-fuconolactonase